MRISTTCLCLVLLNLLQILIVNGLLSKHSQTFNKERKQGTTKQQSRFTISTTATAAAALAASSNTIDFQSDESQFGRSDRHLSAMLEEGDVIVYRCGSWFVDGVLVGDEEETEFRLAQVDTIQIVWTHNCEHGCIRGMAVTLIDEQTIQVDESDYVEFGPEQLIARLPINEKGHSKSPLDQSMWEDI